MLSEKIFRVGNQQALNGVLTRPRVSEQNEHKPILLILNSGLIHHVGNSRIGVTLARRAADLGMTSYRFDFSGIGDSPPRRGGSFIDNALSELKEVMDALEAFLGVKKFLCFGLCSGSDVEFAAAQRDSRIIGMIQIDPYVYRTPGWYVRHLFARIKDNRSWRNLALRLIGKTPSKEDLYADMVEVSEETREFPLRQEVEQGYRKLVERRVKILVFLTGGQIYTLNHKSQFRANFPEVVWGAQLQDYYIPEAEHILPEPEPRKFVIQEILLWLARF